MPYHQGVELLGAVESTPYRALGPGAGWMRRRRLAPDLVSYTALLAVADASQALETLEEMQKAFIEPQAFAYNAALQA